MKYFLLCYELCTYCFPGNCKEALLKEIDADNLPACYGGNLKDANGDPRCGIHVGFHF